MSCGWDAVSNVATILSGSLSFSSKEDDILSAACRVDPWYPWKSSPQKNTNKFLSCNYFFLWEEGLFLLLYNLEACFFASKEQDKTYLRLEGKNMILGRSVFHSPSIIHIFLSKWVNMYSPIPCSPYIGKQAIFSISYLLHETDESVRTATTYINTYYKYYDKCFSYLAHADGK